MRDFGDDPLTVSCHVARAISPDDPGERQIERATRRHRCNRAFCCVARRHPRRSRQFILEILMRSFSPLHLVNAALVFGVLLSVADVGAQPAAFAGDGPDKLVYTSCNQGQVNVCGTEPTQSNCTYKFDLNLDPKDRAFGFNFGGWVCTPVGQRNLYKDFFQKASSGTCVVFPKFPADGSSTGRPDDDIEEPSDSEPTC